MRKNLVIPLLLLSVISYGQTTINNFYTTMSILNLDSLKRLPDSSKSYDTKTIVRADLMWRSQLSPHGNPSVASAGIINYANNFVAPSNSNSLTGGSSNSTEIGPIGTPSNSGGDGNGQINRIAFDPNYNGTTNKVMYAGSFHGGLWKSTDGGNNWLVHGTDDQLPITSVSGIAISHQNTNKLFVCTGDGDERDFVIDYNTNLDGRNPNFTIGVYRSLDDGLSWNPINLGLTKDAANNPINFADGGVCRQLRINPNDESILFVATSRGLYRSSNATDVNAPSWTKLNVNNNTNWMDDYRGLEFHPTNSNIVYTSSKDIFKSTNGGNVWTSMTGPGTGLDLATFNSNFSVKRINITVTPAAPDRLYAYINGTEFNPVTNYHHQAVYVYMLKNGQWEELNYTIQPFYVNSKGEVKPDGYNSYPVSWMAIAVSPVDPEKVYIGYTKVKGSTDITAPNSSFIGQAPYVAGGQFHADVHELIFQPNTPNPKMFCGHHGGISLKDISSNNENGWVYKNNGLNTSLIWSFDVSKVNSNIVGIGRQDNGVNVYKPLFSGGQAWTRQGGGDGYGFQITDDTKGNGQNPKYAMDINYSFYNFGLPWDALPSAINPPNFIGDYKRLEAVPAQFQIIDHPETHKAIYGFSDLYSSNNADFSMPSSNSSAANPYKVESDLYADFDLSGKNDTVSRYERQVSEFDISKSNPDYVYAVTLASYSNGTNLYRSTTGLSNGVYTDVSAGKPASTVFENITANLPMITYTSNTNPPTTKTAPPYISGIAISPSDHEKVWISVGGYEDKFRVFQTTDGGNTWANADPTGTLPELPTNNIVVVEGTNDMLFIATNAGVYTTEGGTNVWTKVPSIPNVQVRELRINACSNKLFAATYGRGVWSLDLPEPNRAGNEKVIDINTTWTENRYLENNLRIKEGMTLVIQGTLHMPYNGHIFVEAGGTLEVDGGTIKNDCGTFWSGIEVWGKSNLTQASTNQGKLILKNNAVIENAHTAVSLMKTDDWGSMGGIIIAEDATFKNCRRAVQFMSYKKPNISSFTRCKFILDDNFNPEGLGEINQVTLWDVRGVQFKGCEFSDNRTTVGTFSLNSGSAIFSIDAGYQLKGDCSLPNQGNSCPVNNLTRSKVKNFNIGVHALGSSTSNTIAVDQTDFEGNMQATVIEALDNFRFIRNNVTIGATAKIGYNNPNQIGLYNYQSTGFEIEANLIGSNTSISNLNTVGLLIKESGTEANQVYRNNFQNNSMGAWFFGLNRNQNQYEGMQYLCNTFFNGTDVKVEEDPNGQNSNNHGIRTYQGAHSPSESAGNQFPPTMNNFLQLENASNQGIVYYYNSTAEQMQTNKVTPPGLIMQLHTANTNSCAQLFKSSYGGNVVNNLNSEFYRLRDEYDALLYTYFQNIDGGNTDSLLQAINMSWNNEAQDLRDELMSQAPYLSEQALREAAETGILTDALLLEICLANMDATRNEDFLNFLQNEIPNTLPESMIQLIYQNWSGETPRTILENQIAVTNAEMGIASNQLMHYYMTDSLDHNDSLESLLAARKHPASVYRMVELAIENNDFEEVSTLIAEIEEGPEMSEWNQNEHNNLKDYIDFRQGLGESNTAILDLGEEALGTLRTIAELKTGRSSQMAQNILCFGYGECTSFEAPEGRKRSRRIYNMNTASANALQGNYQVIPNPAKTSVDLTFEGEETEGSRTMRVYAINGQVLLEKPINSTKTTIDVNHLENGAYLYEVLQDGAVVHQGKLIIQK